MPRLLPRLAALLLTACAGAGPSPLQPPPQPGHVVRPEFAAALLQPCTRPAPEGVDGTWQPSPTAVRELEAGLAAYAAQMARQRPGFGPQRPLATYRGLFTGFVRGGERWIYGSFGPASEVPADSANQRRPVQMCDGGGAYFGVEYHPATREYRHLVRNGEASVPTWPAN